MTMPQQPQRGRGRPRKYPRPEEVAVDSGAVPPSQIGEGIEESSPADGLMSSDELAEELETMARADEAAIGTHDAAPEPSPLYDTALGALALQWASGRVIDAFAYRDGVLTVVAEGAKKSFWEGM